MTVSRPEELIRVLEIGSGGTAATLAAYLLGLYRVDLLMVVFFSMTLAGQFLSAMLDRVSRLARE
jgi:hypothetical protein